MKTRSMIFGIFAFAAVVLAAPLDSAYLFRAGTGLIGFGSGLFAIGTLTAAMEMASETQSGLALGAWGAVQATATGIAIALGGAMRDSVAHLAENGHLGSALTGPATGYGAVYHVEIFVLFAALAVIGPLVRVQGEPALGRPAFYLNDIPQ